jgi:hypothetical protein
MLKIEPQLFAGADAPAGLIARFALPTCWLCQLSVASTRAISA